LKIIGHGNPDNNFESSCMFKALKKITNLSRRKPRWYHQENENNHTDIHAFVTYNSGKIHTLFWAGRIAHLYSAGLRAIWSAVRVWAGAGNFSLTDYGEQQPFYPMGNRGSFLETHHSPPSSAEVKNVLRYSSIPPIHLNCVVLCWKSTGATLHFLFLSYECKFKRLVHCRFQCSDSANYVTHQRVRKTLKFSVFHGIAYKFDCLVL
jgi:hypothetical protein